MQEVQTAVIVDGSVPSEVVLNGSRAGETWIDCSIIPSIMPQQPLCQSAKWAMAPFLAHQVRSFAQADTLWDPLATHLMLQIKI